jgi:hypothetical protein
VARKLKRIDITCSIDCWGPEQEYVRWGMKLDQWEHNFNTLLDTRWLKLNINQTISPLTIKTVPALLAKLKEWRQIRHVGHFFSEVTPGPSYLKPDILGDIFADDFQMILDMMPHDDEQDEISYEYMKGIANRISKSSPDATEISKLQIYLTEKDRRRGTDFAQVFPWLVSRFDIG